jgi:hypothetical protein
MTKKSFAKLQRQRAGKRASRGSGSSRPNTVPHVEPEPTAEAPPLVVRVAADGDDHIEFADSRLVQTQKSRPSARCAIAAAAFYSATNGAIRRQLKKRTATALIVLVPGPSWLEPIRKLFVARFGEHWQALPTEAIKASQLTERNSGIAADLSKGHPIVGVAVDRVALPSALVAAADVTIRIAAPGGIIIGRAIRLFTGRPAPVNIDEKIASGLEFHDIVAALRPNSSPAEILERLRRASPATPETTAAERLPDLEQATEYGAARTWGLVLARDLADYRAGQLAWEEVDRGAVLFSEPGLGKSLFARILAKACGVPLVAYSVADLFASSPGYLDSVIKASRQMFERAAAIAPCILFLDEIDALPNRATMSPRGADWWTSVITDFLLSLDNAVAGKRAGIVVVAATNNIKGVDAAVLRPGRLERAIEIQRPDYGGTVNILRHHVNGALTDADIADLAHLLEGATGAEIMMVVRGARRIARYGGRPLERDDLLQAIAPPEDVPHATLNRICIHEAAHAVAAIVARSGVVKRCIVGGAGAAGRTLIWTDPHEMPTRDSVERRAVVLLCGRTAGSTSSETRRSGRVATTNRI